MGQVSYSDIGVFATSRRGTLSTEQIHEIAAHRARDRPTPWQALAKRYGVPEATIRHLLAETYRSAPQEAPQVAIKPRRKDVVDQAVSYLQGLSEAELREISQRLNRVAA